MHRYLKSPTWQPRRLNRARFNICEHRWEKERDGISTIHLASVTGQKCRGRGMNTAAGGCGGIRECQKGTAGWFDLNAWPVGFQPVLCVCTFSIEALYLYFLPLDGRMGRGVDPRIVRRAVYNFHFPIN